MKVREKNPLLKKMVETARSEGLAKGVPAWEAVAEKLNRPRSVSHKVNLHGLERNAKAKETILVPGTVLGAGQLTKPLTVAALRFSASARKGIEGAGGSCLTIEELMKKSPKGSKVRIMG